MVFSLNNMKIVLWLAIVSRNTFINDIYLLSSSVDPTKRYLLHSALIYADTISSVQEYLSKNK